MGWGGEGGCGSPASSMVSMTFSKPFAVPTRFNLPNQSQPSRKLSWPQLPNLQIALPGISKAASCKSKPRSSACRDISTFSTSRSKVDAC